MTHDGSRGDIQATFELLEVIAAPHHVPNFSPLVQEGQDIQCFTNLVSTLLHLKKIGQTHKLITWYNRSDYRGKLSFYWSSERHSELSPPRKECTNEGKS